MTLFIVKHHKIMSNLSNTKFRDLAIHVSRKSKLTLYRKIRNSYESSSPIISYLNKKWDMFFYEAKNMELNDAIDMLLDVIIVYKKYTDNIDLLEPLELYSNNVFRVKKLLNLYDVNIEDLKIINAINGKLYETYIETNLFDLPDYNENYAINYTLNFIENTYEADLQHTHG